jgi:CRISPR-associated protein Csx17
VAAGRDEIRDCCAVVERRLVEAARGGDRNLPLVAAAGAEAQPSDLAALVAGGLDFARTVGLARALMAVRWGFATPPRGGAEELTTWPDEAWMAIRLACLPWPLDDGSNVAVDGGVVRRLVTGDAATAVELALRRLRAAGIRPPLRAGIATPDTARRWAAALAFPISRGTARAMARRCDPNRRKENT